MSIRGIRSGGRDASFRALVVLVAICAWAPGAGAETGPPELAGRSLSEALDELRLRGLEIVYSSRLVRPEMLVEREPAVDSLLEATLQILEPHGLRATLDTSGWWVVVRAEPTASAPVVRGQVLSALGGRPLSGARVTLLQGVVSAVTNADGAFELRVEEPGPHTLRVALAGFLEQSLDGLHLRGGEDLEVHFRLSPLHETRDEITVTAEPLVEIPVWVARRGAPVRGLTARNFEVILEGKRREIVDFEILERGVGSGTDVGGALPVPSRRQFWLLFDLSVSALVDLARIRTAALELVEQRLHPTDLVAVGTYSGNRGARLILNFTRDRRQAAAAISALNAEDVGLMAADPLHLLLKAEREARSSWAGHTISMETYADSLGPVIASSKQEAGRPVSHLEDLVSPVERNED